jgi:CRISPR-associated protein Csc2
MNKQINTNVEDNPDHGFVEKLERYRKVRPSVTLVVDRNVVSPILLRNSDDAMAETTQFDGQIHAKANAEKFKSVERLTGLNLLRQLDELFGDENDTEWSEWSFSDEEIPAGLIADEYVYNNAGRLEESLNHDTLTYGVVGTDTDNFSYKSLVTEGYTYSLNEYDVTAGEIRNAVKETGTMKDENGEQTSSLYERNPVGTDNRFLHFVTIESATPEVLTYVVHNILNSTDYGGRDTSHGKTLDNSILAVITSRFDVGLSTAEYIGEYGGTDEYDVLPEYLESETNGDARIYSNQFDAFEEFPEWYQEMERLANLNDLEALYKLLRDDLETNINSLFDTRRP